MRLVQYGDLENAYDRPERVGRLAGLVADLDGPNAVVVGTGDDTAPGVLSLVTEGRQAFDLFDAIDPAVETPGNHDFDYGIDAMRELVRDSPQAWVCANVDIEGVTPSTVVPVDGGRVGFVGVLDPRTPSMCPPAAELTVTDPLDAVERELPALRERAGRVVALAHVDEATSETIARLDGVDAVLAGHVHEERVGTVAGTPLVRPGANGRAVATVDLDSGTVERHPVDAVTAPGPVGEAVTQALRERLSAAGLDEVVAHVEDPIERRPHDRKAGESRVGNLVADAYRWTAGTDVALQNTGGIRGGPPLAGAVTVADLVSLVPFDEPVVVAELAGEELRAVCRQADGRRLDGLSDHWHAHVSGMAIAVADEGVDTGGTGDLSVRVGGDPLDTEETYTLATSAYLLHADHEFPALTERHRVATLESQYEALARYAREEGIAPRVEGRLRLDGHGG
jgi:2',3'-cyclic-nucleotide 2'-phosphodiesterase (5'-nucleotidase family)